MSEQDVIVGRCLQGILVAYLVAPDEQQGVWKWLNSLSCVESAWAEPLSVWRNRRIKGAK